MSTQLGLYTRTGGKTHMCSACNTCDLKDYTGSYHVSISLPHSPDGWILYDEKALSEDGSECSATYVRDCLHDGETPLSVWVDAHMVGVVADEPCYARDVFCVVCADGCLVGWALPRK